MTVMTVGDLVRVKISDPDVRNRYSGILLGFDTWDTRRRRIYPDRWYTLCSDDAGHDEPGPVCTRIARVLWDDGPSWIDAQRIEPIVIP
jgi:hypothetical protein